MLVGYKVNNVVMILVISYPNHFYYGTLFEFERRLTSCGYSLLDSVTDTFWNMWNELVISREATDGIQCQ